MERCLPRSLALVPWLVLYLEELGFLDPSNEVHLFCLHYICLPRIRQHLSMWKDAWNMHPLRTESNQSPIQLWTGGQLHSTGLTAEDELVDEVNNCIFYMQASTPLVI